MSPDKFEAALAEQQQDTIDWAAAMSAVHRLSELHAAETDISAEQIQLVVVMEELAELSQEVSKMVRRRGNRTCVLEELADVSIMCRYLQEALNIDDEELARAINVKLSRYSLAAPNTETQ